MTALGASPSDRRLAQHIEASGARGLPLHPTPTPPPPDSAQQLTTAAPGPHHSSRSIKNKTLGWLLLRNGSATWNALGRFASESAHAGRRPLRAGRADGPSCANAMRNALELFFALKKACGSVSEAPVSLPALPAAVTAKALCARLRRISEPRALRAPEEKVVPPLPRNADAAPFRCFCRRLRPQCRQ